LAGRLGFDATLLARFLLARFLPPADFVAVAFSDWPIFAFVAPLFAVFFLARVGGLAPFLALE
jgi:hypothetical protein